MHLQVYFYLCFLNNCVICTLLILGASNLLVAATGPRTDHSELCWTSRMFTYMRTPCNLESRFTKVPEIIMGILPANPNVCNFKSLLTCNWRCLAASISRPLEPRRGAHMHMI